MRSTSPLDSAPAAREAAPAAAPEAAAGRPLDAAVAQGQQWLKNIDLNQFLGQVPQSVRGLGNRVADRVRSLTPAQQAVGGAVLAFGLGWLAVRGRRPDRAAGAEAAATQHAKFDGKLFKGRGKARYAGS